MSGSEAALAGSLKFPFQFARGGIHRVEVAIETAEINDAFRNGGRRRNSACGLEFPLESAGSSIESVKVVITTADIDSARGDSGGGEDLAVCVKLPLCFSKLRNAGTHVNAGVLRIAPKHGVLRQDWRTEYK